MAGDYEVGYRKPPKHTQFKPGQSGNRSGRPRTRKMVTNRMDMRRSFMKAMEQEVTVVRDGQRTQVVAIHALYDQLLKKALAGDLRSSKLLIETYSGLVMEDEDDRMKLAEELGRFVRAREKAEDEAWERMTPEERDMADDLAARRARRRES